MSLNELLLILKARRNVIAITFASIVALALLISLLMPKTYEASTSLLLNYKGMDPVTGDILPSQLMPGYIATQIDVIRSRNVAMKVVDKLKWDKEQSNIDEFKKFSDEGDIKIWLADLLLVDLFVRPSTKSSVIEIAYKSTDPKFAAKVANTFAEAYEEVNIQLKVQPAKKAAIFFGVQTNSLRQQVEDAQSKLSKYQQLHEITSVDGSIDVEAAKLNELSSQLIVAQGQLFDSKSRKASSTNGSHSPDVASNPLVRNLKVDVSRASAKLKELSGKYGESHPKYIAAKAELDEQRKLLGRARRNASGNVKETFNIYSQRVSQIKAAVAKQKEKVLKLNLSRDEYNVLKNEVVNAEKAMDIASERFNATLQQASSNQSDLSVLNPAIAPIIPSNTTLLFNLLVAMCLGLLLGITFALFSEIKDKRIRSKEDLNRLLEMEIFSISDGDDVKRNPTQQLAALEG